MTNERHSKTDQRQSDFALILPWLQDGPTPPEGIVFSSSLSAKYFWIHREELTIMKGVDTITRQGSTSSGSKLGQELSFTG